MGLALCAVLLSGLAFRSLRLRHALRGGAAGLLALALFGAASALATLSLSVRGYHALTHEELAATLRTKPLGEQIFLADLELPDGSRHQFQIEGDQLYVDAHILKWKPMANLLGLHTEYELDRVGGRYREIGAERDSVRTVYSLAVDKPLDMFSLRGRWSFLEPLLDAEYGSGTFQEVEEPSTFEVRVSTTGLLIRPRDEG